MCTDELVGAASENLQGIKVLTGLERLGVVETVRISANLQL